MAAEVVFGVDVLASGVLEFGGDDTVDESDVLGGLAEPLATEDELAVDVSEELVQVDRRRNPSLVVGFSALSGENTLLHGDLAESVGERHYTEQLGQYARN
jgi:hypothetical protein